ncbi:S-adenosyl-L-methionine-dependent methyltransferase [Podospora appendiculata]|uniref:type I protein arginine methyltransferase n=1 Tax=Podospora appendiculata TaxID=314037 RepID=A0AAE0X2K4_9PEZI|nr:S-adenosyl-L-methionine-dependent methyltransferase [Podospora appendiculata]
MVAERDLPLRNGSASSSGSDSSSSASGEGEWLDADQDDEQEAVAVISLLDDAVFPDALSMIAHCKDKYGFDFLAVRERLQLDFHGTVKLINFVRQRVHEGAEVPAEISQADLEDDRYLKPVLDDDALILCLDDLPETGAAAAAASASASGLPSSGVDASLDVELKKSTAELQAELEQLTKQFTNYRLAVQKTLDERWQANDEPDDVPGAKGGEAKDDSAYYFESYAHNDIHEIMIKDAVRTDAYRDFIYGNKHLFAGKVVLDIGCGTGILSMFCARAGAKQVIAVDNSDILNKARENIFNNGLADVITCLKGRIEDVVLPVAKVDIIVSEWMGYCLLYEAMLPSILFARDRYLQPVTGLLVPSHANIWIAPVSDQEYVADHISWWRDVYGFDMKAMQSDIYTDARPQVLPAQSICGSPSAFRFLDLHTVRNEDLVFEAPWQTTLAQSADSLDGFLVWFDMFFSTKRDDPSIKPDSTAQAWAAAPPAPSDGERVAFTTGPFGTETHWRQGLLLLDTNKVKPVVELAGKVITGDIAFITADNHARGVDLKVTWGTDEDSKQTQKWQLH